MAASAKVGTPALIAGSAGTHYSVSPGAVGNIKEVLLCNIDTTTAYTVTVYFVNSGGSAGDSTTVIKAATVAAGTTVRFPFNTFIDAGGTVQALASTTNKISIRVSAVEFT